METIILDEATQKRYRDIYYRSNILFTFWTLLCWAQFYSQKGYENYYINYVEVSGFLVSTGYNIYQIIRNKGIVKYISNQVAPYYTWKSTIKKILVLIGLIIGAALLVIRFFLPEQIVYYMQNIFYISAFLVPIYGVMTISYSR